MQNILVKIHFSRVPGTSFEKLGTFHKSHAHRNVHQLDLLKAMRSPKVSSLISFSCIFEDILTTAKKVNFTVLLPELFCRCYLFILKTQIFAKSLVCAQCPHAISTDAMRLYCMFLIILC